MVQLLFGVSSSQIPSCFSRFFILAFFAFGQWFNYLISATYIDYTTLCVAVQNFRSLCCGADKNNATHFHLPRAPASLWLYVWWCTREVIDGWTWEREDEERGEGQVASFLFAPPLALIYIINFALSCECVTCAAFYPNCYNNMYIYDLDPSFFFCLPPSNHKICWRRW